MDALPLPSALSLDPYRHLAADRREAVTLIAAAALGRADDVARELPAAPPAEIEEAFVLACGYGRTAVAELFLDGGLATPPRC